MLSGLPSQGIWGAYAHRAAKLVPALKGETIYRGSLFGVLILLCCKLHVHIAAFVNIFK